MIAILFFGGIFLFYLLCMMCFMLHSCVEKIPGAAQDEKFKKISKYFDIDWYLPVDKTPPMHYNDRVRHHQVPKNDDRYWNHWNNDAQH